MRVPEKVTEAPSVTASAPVVLVKTQFVNFAVVETPVIRTNAEFQEQKEVKSWPLYVWKDVWEEMCGEGEKAEEEREERRVEVGVVEGRGIPAKVVLVATREP